MSDTTTNNNVPEEKPAEFYKEKDLLGLDKSNTEPGEDRNSSSQEPTGSEDALAPATPESEFQSVKHFVILNLLSLNVYLFFWFYKHWRYLRDEKKQDISPGFRTLFIIFTGYSLFARFKKLALEKGYEKKAPYGILFLVYTALILLCRIKETELLIIPAYFAFLLFIPALNLLNFYYLKEQPNHRVKKKLGTDEIVFLIVFWVGLILYLFS